MFVIAGSKGFGRPGIVIYSLQFVKATSIFRTSTPSRDRETTVKSVITADHILLSESTAGWPEISHGNPPLQ